MQLDFCHAFHLGCGIDMAASCIVLLCRLGHYGNARALPERLDAAFASYMRWCHTQKRVTSIREFSLLKFDMATKPGISRLVAAGM